MKKINDEQIIKLVKQDSNYQVKTTAQSILNQYAYETKLEKQAKPRKKHKGAIIFGSALGSLAIATAAIGGIFLYINNQNNVTDMENVFPDLDPVNNKTIQKQLITFSAFAGQKSQNINYFKNIKRANLIDDEEDEEPTVQTNKEVLIKKSIDLYESVETSVNYLYHENNIKTETVETKATFDKQDYSLVTKFYYDDSNEAFALYYFNKPTEETNDDELIRISKAYYECEGLKFNIDVTEEIEKDDEEEEIETKLVLRDVNGVNKNIYVVEKEIENETENGTVASENSLSIKTFESESAFNEDNYLRKLTSETEVEDNENEIEVSIKDSKVEVEFNINKIDEHNLDLKTSYEEKEADESNFEDEIIHLEYKDNLRIYTWKDSIWKF